LCDGREGNEGVAQFFVCQHTQKNGCLGVAAHPKKMDVWVWQHTQKMDVWFFWFVSNIFLYSVL
jgi:hypothetical protein